MSAPLVLFIGFLLLAIGWAAHVAFLQDALDDALADSARWRTIARRETSKRLATDEALAAALLDRPDAKVIAGPWGGGHA